MVKREAHIDIVFRNGLKEMEILPPADLWDEIAPAIATRREAYPIFRVAAGIAALVSIGLLAYFTGIRTSGSLAGGDFTGNIQDASTVADSRFIAEASQPVSSIGTLASTRSTAEIITRSEFSNGGSPVFIPEPIDVRSIREPASAVANNVITRTSNEIPESLPVNVPDEFNQISLSPVEVASLAHVSRQNWKVGAQVSPTYLSSSLKAANGSMGELVSNENAILSYSGGISLSYNMGERLSLQTGLYYSSLGREISGIDSYSGFSGIAGSKSGTVFGIETTAGTIATTNRDIYLADVSANRIQSIYNPDNFDPIKADLTPLGASLVQNFEYLEIPLILSYKVIDRKIDFNIQGGLSYNFLLDNKTYAVGDGSKVLVGSTRDINNLLLSSALGINVEYSLNNRFTFNLGPSVRYFLNNSGRFSIDNPYTIGVYSGLFYKF